MNTDRSSMRCPMNSDRHNQYEAWESEYNKKGRIWKRSPVFSWNVVPKKPVLEVGVGNGKNLQRFSFDRYKVTILDISRSALDLVRKDMDVCGNVFPFQADVCFLPFVDASYSTIYMVHLLDHLLEKGRIDAIKEIQRVLKPGGTVYITVFGDSDMRCGKGIPVEERTFRRGNNILTHYFTEEEVSSLFSSDYQVTIERHIWELKIKQEIHTREELHVAVYSS